jgi:CRP/FNR family cyclic AMP-dependent transcriptional regulator
MRQAGAVTELEDALGKMPVLARLSPDDRAALAKELTRARVRRGTEIVHEGEIGQELFLILDGKVKITRASADGRENLLAVLGPGEVFGELSLFDPGPRTATATALGSLDYAILKHSALLPWLSGRPTVALLLLRVLARRLRRSNSALADMTFVDVPGRVAGALLELGGRFGTEYPDGSLRVDHGLTQEELAQLVGASRETVNKALAEFVSRGWLRLESRAVVILDRNKLVARSG